MFEVKQHLHLYVRVHSCPRPVFLRFLISSIHWYRSRTKPIYGVWYASISFKFVVVVVVVSLTITVGLWSRPHSKLARSVINFMHLIQAWFIIFAAAALIPNGLQKYLTFVTHCISLLHYTCQNMAIIWQNWAGID